MISKSVCYCTNLRRGANAITDCYDRALKAIGVTITQYAQLVHLKRLGSANTTQWADYLGLDRSTMVRNIRLLVERQLVTRTEGHGKTWMLSPAGEDLVARTGPLWQKVQQKVARVLGSDDAAALLRIAEKLQQLQDAGLQPQDREAADPRTRAVRHTD